MSWASWWQEAKADDYAAHAMWRREQVEELIDAREREKANDGNVFLDKDLSKA